MTDGPIFGRHPHHPTGPTSPTGPAPAPTGPTGPSPALLPTGPIRAIGGGLDWSAITRYAAELRDANQRTAVPVSRLAGHIVIESRGDKRAIQKNTQNGWSYGLMQIVPYGVGWEGWHALVAHIAGVRDEQDLVIEALYLPSVNIATGAEILRQGRHAGETWDQASSRFFTGNPNWQGVDTVNGTNGQTYRQVLDNLIAEWEAGGGVRPAPTGATGPAPKPKPIDPIAVIVGGVAYPPITYGFRADAGIASYKFGYGHGTTAITQHTGVDVGVPHGTALFAPMDGLVRCVGSNGTPDWGQSCGSYLDDMYGGPGNITIMLDGQYQGSQVKLTLGHCMVSTVHPGDRVRAGQQVGKSGGSNGDHVHVETSIYAPDRVDKVHNYYPDLPYFLVEPIACLATAMGGDAPVVYAPTWPVPQPEDLDRFVTVTVTAASVPVLQYASMSAPPVKPDILKGDTFDAAHQVLADDGSVWWIGRYHGRVPVKGTSAPDWGAT